ncbi:hypothetical protein VCHC17A1_4082A, partial [Vibrio cholerae HC-17A1]
MVSVAEILT